MYKKDVSHQQGSKSRNDSHYKSDNKWLFDRKHIKHKKKKTKAANLCQFVSVTRDKLFACEESACESSAADLQSPAETEAQLASTRSHTDLIARGGTVAQTGITQGPMTGGELQPHDQYCLGYLGQRGLNRTVELAQMQRLLLKSEASNYRFMHESRMMDNGVKLSMKGDT